VCCVWETGEKDRLEIHIPQRVDHCFMGQHRVAMRRLSDAQGDSYGYYPLDSAVSR
jgi:hypothetical protein